MRNQALQGFGRERISIGRERPAGPGGEKACGNAVIRDRPVGAKWGRSKPKDYRGLGDRKWST